MLGKPHILSLLINSIKHEHSCKILFVSSADNFCKQFGPDQARQIVRPALDPNCLTLMVFLKEFFDKVDFERNQQKTKKA